MKNLVEINPRILKLNFSNGEISWKVFGSGAKKMLAFHGFGQSGEAFLPLTEAHPDYTIYAMDLPFHGATNIYDKTLPLTPKQVVELINNLILGENIKHFSLIGFSIGVKLIFPIVEAFAMQIQEITLIAPDGIKENFWYRLATGTLIMRNIFRHVLRSDYFLNQMIILASSLHIVNSKTASFIQISLSDKERKLKVYDIWTYLRMLKLDQVKLSNVINLQAIPVNFVVGDNDQVIPAKSIVGLTSRINHYRIVELQSGHQGLIKKYSEKIIQQSKKF